ncbi:MAG: hypothetical protein V1914_00175 [archaeon]
MQKVKTVSILAKESRETCSAFPSRLDTRTCLKFTKQNQKCKIDFKIASTRDIATIKINECLNIDKPYEEYYNPIFKIPATVVELGLILNTRPNNTVKRLNEAMISRPMLYRTS